MRRSTPFHRRTKLALLLAGSVVIAALTILSAVRALGWEPHVWADWSHPGFQWVHGHTDLAGGDGEYRSQERMGVHVGPVWLGAFGPIEP